MQSGNPGLQSHLVLILLPGFNQAILNLCNHYANAAILFSQRFGFHPNTLNNYVISYFVYSTNSNITLTLKRKLTMTQSLHTMS